MGNPLQLTEWTVIDVAEVDLTFPVLITPKVTKAEYQNRDNVINHYRLQLDGGKGLIFTQRTPEAFYGNKAEQQYRDMETFKKALSEAFKADLVSVGDIREVRHSSKKAVGFATVVDVKDPAKSKCFVAKVGYRVKGATSYDNDYGNVDTFVEIVYCDPGVRFGDFSRALENVGFVEDRAAFAAALAAK